VYERFFSLRVDPFSASPDPRYLLLTTHVKEALACIAFGLQARKGFILLTGEVGTGKTTLLNNILEWLRLELAWPTAFIFNPRLDPDQFLEFMMADFGIPSGSGGKSQLLLRLNFWLLEHRQAGRTAVLIVDEAQNLSTDVLEEIRLLANLETATEKLLQIVLSGQPELEQKLKDPQLRQLRQRISLRCKMHSLTLDQTRSYISQRLLLAGANGVPIFSSEAMEAIWRHSGGIPRIINQLCEHSLISAFVDNQWPVLRQTVDVVASEFEL
jgi:general secretion pathway protein A